MAATDTTTTQEDAAPNRFLVLVTLTFVTMLYAMTVTIGPYATLMNDPALSKTAGKWAWGKVPGGSTPDDSTSSVGGWAMGVAGS